MDWMDEVCQKIKRRNRVLFGKDSPLLTELSALLAGQNRRAVVLWAFSLAEETVSRLGEQLPGEEQPAAMLAACRLWAAGTVKMPAARREILACHALAKSLPPEEAALCHAAAQACSTVHTPGHALGFPLYELTALVLRHGPESCREPVEKRAAEYCGRLIFWQKEEQKGDFRWAEFLRRD